jgi:hypothetical protein
VSEFIPDINLFKFIECNCGKKVCLSIKDEQTSVTCSECEDKHKIDLLKQEIEELKAERDSALALLSARKPTITHEPEAPPLPPWICKPCNIFNDIRDDVCSSCGRPKVEDIVIVNIGHDRIAIVSHIDLSHIIFMMFVFILVIFYFIVTQY